MSEKVFFNLQPDVEQTEAGPKLVGHAAIFESLSEDLGGYRARIKRGAFDKALASGKDIFALVDHDDTKPLGNLSGGTLKLSIDNIGLRAEITPPDTTYARDALEQVKMKLKKGMSIQFNTGKASIKWAKEQGNKIRDIYSIDELQEVSVVTVPAFSQTDIAATFSLPQEKEPAKEVKKHNKAINKGNITMSLSWSDIKALEEQKAVVFSQANTLRQKNELTEEESAELDRLCTEAESYDAQISDAKSVYFGKQIVAPRKVVQAAEKKSFVEASGITKKDLQRYSLLRAVGKKLRNEPLDGLEGEINDELTKFNGKAPQGFYFPTELSLFGASERYDFDTTAGTGAINETVLTTAFIDLLRARTLVDRLGATYLTNLVGNISVPKQTAGATAYWVAEGNAPTESAQTVGQVALTPKTVGCYTDITRKMILQTSMSAEAFVRNDLATTLALAIDAAAINGSGTSNEPRGILNTSGVHEVETTGDVFEDMVDLEAAVEEANALNGSLAYVMRPGIKQTLKTTSVDTGAGIFVWQNNQVNGYPAYSTTQIPNDVSSYGNMTPVIFANWSDLVIGMWGSLDILVDPYTASNSGTVRIRALQDVDVVLRHAESFAACYFD